MRTDNHCIAVFVALALRSEKAFSLRHPSFEAGDIPLILSRVGAFNKREAKDWSRCFSSHICGCWVPCSNWQTRHHQSFFYLPMKMKWIISWAKKRGGSFDIKARAPGFNQLQKAFPRSKITEQLGGYWSERDCPVNEGCRCDPWSSRLPAPVLYWSDPMPNQCSKASVANYCRRFVGVSSSFSYNWIGLELFGDCMHILINKMHQNSERECSTDT